MPDSVWNIYEVLLILAILFHRVFSKVKSRSAHMKIHRPDQDKEREKKAKLAKQAAAAAAAAASLEQSFIDPFRYSSFPNGPSQT